MVIIHATHGAFKEKSMIKKRKVSTPQGDLRRAHLKLVGRADPVQKQIEDILGLGGVFERTHLEEDPRNGAPILRVTVYRMPDGTTREVSFSLPYDDSYDSTEWEE